MERYLINIENVKKNVLICRICLEHKSEENEKKDYLHNNLISLFGKYNDYLICDKINDIVSFNIQEDDGLPDKICVSCVQALEAAYEFKQKCEHSNHILRSAIQAGVPFHKGLIEDLIKQEPLNSKHDEELLHSEELHGDGIKHEYTEHSEDTGQSDGDTQGDDCSEELHSDGIKHDYTEQSDVDTQGDECQPSEELTPHINTTFKSKAIDLHLECHDCGQFFKSKCKLRVHWKREHMPTQLTCPNCKKVCKTYKTFHAHMRQKSKSCIIASIIKIEGEGKSRIYYCSECEYKAKNMNNMKIHWRTHTGERPYSCKICNKSYSQTGGLQSHNESVHKTIKKETICKHCGKHIIGRDKYNRHVRSHTASFPCTVCGKVLKSKTTLADHMKRHTGIKSYACEMCAKMFCTGPEILNHIAKVHKKSRCYKCDKCEYSNTSHDAVTNHKRGHTDTNIPCLICGKFVNNELQLKLHQERHNKNFVCEHCDKRFASRKSLLTHMRNIHKIKISQEKDKLFKK